jgi:hypothetical protein
LFYVMSYALGRGMRSVRCAKGVINVDVG